MCGENIYLTRYGKLLKEHLLDEKPKWYREMEAEGTLMQYLYEKEQRAINQRNHLIDQGLNISEAEEMIWQELMSLP